MTDVVATDARRTKNSIIFYIALTAALSQLTASRQIATADGS